MTIRDTLSISVKSLARNKKRSALTMLGIIIGIASVILMLSVGQAAERYILSQVASFGSDLIFVRNGPGDGRQGSGPPTQAVKQTITIDDFDKLKQQSWIRSVGADVYSDLLVEYEGQNFHVRVAGTAETEPIMFNTEIQDGSFYTEDDISSANAVTVIGSGLASDLFGAENPIGKRVKIQKKSYRVIGVMKPAGTKFFTDLDRQVYVPITTLMQQLNIDRLQFMTVKIGNTPPADAKERIRLLLRDTHKLDNPIGDLSKDDFFVATQEDIMQKAGIIGSILQILLTSIAAISLVVGGVGIMNIMYVTVTERTREIGLRKAIGANARDILAQFLSEAVVLSMLAGIAGIVAGLGMSWLGLLALSRYQSGWSFAAPLNAVALGFGVSVAIGIVFGYFPALRAAKLHPIEALRYE